MHISPSAPALAGAIYEKDDIHIHNTNQHALDVIVSRDRIRVRIRFTSDVST